jgi:hypothetical protein
MWDDREEAEKSLTDEELTAVVRVVQALVDKDADYLQEIGAYEPHGADPYLWTRDYGRWDEVTLVFPPRDPKTWILGVFRDGTNPEWIGVDVQMWTEQEGRSDLTLQLDLRLTADGPPRPSFRSLHVM